MDVVTLGMAKAAGDQRYQRTLRYSEDIGNTAIPLGAGVFTPLMPRFAAPPTTSDVALRFGAGVQITAAGAGSIMIGVGETTGGATPTAFLGLPWEVSGGFTAGTWSAFWTAFGEAPIGSSATWREFRLFGYVGRDTSSALAASCRASGASPSYSTKPWMRAVLG